MDIELTLIDLANFTGKPSTYYDRFVSEAISQAEDLFELATEISGIPGDGMSLRLLKRGVLSMAEAIYEGQNGRDLRFSPFRSETIGSYSYSLASAAISQGIPTGVSWFDLAVSHFREDALVTNSSIHAFDRPGDYSTDADGNTYLIGPADTEDFRGSPRVSGVGYSPNPTYVDDWPFT